MKDKRTPTNDWAKGLSADKRIQCAELKLEALVDRTCVAFKTRASNKYMEFPLPNSRPSEAATMFNYIWTAMAKFEALELRALWDPNSEERNSIPTVAYLIELPLVKAELLERTKNQYSDGGASAELSEYLHKRKHEEAEKFEAAYANALHLRNELESDHNFLRLKEFRDYEVAHSISKTGAIIERGKIYRAAPFWNRTIQCLDDLNSAVRRSSFDFQGASDFAERLAKSWWQGLSLTQ